MKIKNQESGRSLIEVIGAMAIASVIAVGAFAAYQLATTRMDRTITTEELRDITRNARILFAGRDNFGGISVNFMVRMGALRNDTPPRIAQDFSINAVAGGGFAINLYGLSHSNCLWISMQYFGFISGVIINDMHLGHPSEHCTNGRNNTATLVVL